MTASLTKERIKIVRREEQGVVGGAVKDILSGTVAGVTQVASGIRSDPGKRPPDRC